ncbi:hypothetical protein ACI65C_010640 [Semiaphis heraclei]
MNKKYFKKSCAVSGCSNNDLLTPGESFFKFPTDCLVKKKWMSLTGTKQSSGYICSKHFLATHFTHNQKLPGRRLRLKKNALPTMYLPISTSTNSENCTSVVISTPRKGVSSTDVLSAMPRSPEIALLENNSSLNDSKSVHVMNSRKNGVSSPLVLAAKLNNDCHRPGHKTSFLFPNGMNQTPIKGRPRVKRTKKLVKNLFTEVTEESTCPSSSISYTNVEPLILDDLPQSPRTKKLKSNIGKILIDGSIVNSQNKCISEVLEENTELKHYTTSLLKEIETLKEENNVYNARIQELEMTVSNQEQSIENNSEHLKNILARFFTEGQVKAIIEDNKNQIRWTSNDISSAMSIHCVSAKAYRFLRDKLKYPLPSISTLRRWATTLKLDVGILYNVLEIMKIKRSSMSTNDSITVISFDEYFISVVEARIDESGQCCLFQ